MGNQSRAYTEVQERVAASIARDFLPSEADLRLSPLGAGLINETYLVDTGAERFVLQRVNGTVFADADAIAENLLRIQDWLGAQADASVRLPRLIPAASGASTLRDADGHAWRLLEHIGSSRVIKPLENLTQAAEVGRALGRFHRALATLDPRRLAFTLPDLHNTPRYKAKLDAAIAAAETIARRPSAQDATGAGPRAMSPAVASALQQIEARAALIPVLSQARTDGALSPSVTHGDPKLDNVLFSRDEDCALCLIDLDTVQPGLLHEDVADCLRSCCNRPGVPGAGGQASRRGHQIARTGAGIAGPSGVAQTSDETITEAQAVFDLNVCRALLGGYAELAAPLFDRDAIALLYPAIRLIPLELAIRFLTDYLEGDRYFRVAYERQNLDKTLIQLGLVADIEAKRRAIEAIIRDSFSERHRRA